MPSTIAFSCARNAFRHRGGIRKLPCIYMSTKSVSLPKLSREYLATWLGSDMSGSSYHERMMNASKSNMNNNVNTVAAVAPQPVPPVLPEPMLRSEPLSTITDITKSEHVALVQQNVAFPVLSINWASASITAIENEASEALLSLDVGASCFLDMSLSEGIKQDHLQSLVSTVVTVVGQSERNISLLAAIYCTDAIKTAAVKASGLNIVSKQIVKPLTNIQFSAHQEVAPAVIEMAPPASARVHYGAVRSGQQIYAEGSSLVIVGSVNNGAEVMADGDIHIYGTLMGRAVAGIGGAAGAHIFAKAFDASLVGVYDAFIAPDVFPELKKVKGKEVSLRLLKSSDNLADLRAAGSYVLDSGSGSSLVVSPL